MTFILRLPAILVLFAAAALSTLGALGAAGIIANYTAPVAQVAEVQAQAAETGAAEAGWIDVGLLAAAAIFFFVSAIRLIRRTQGFWTWLLGFACYGGRWAWEQSKSGDVIALLRSINITDYLNPQAIIADLGSSEAQIGLLAILLIVGLFTLVIDAADHAHWDKQGA